MKIRFLTPLLIFLAIFLGGFAFIWHHYHWDKLPQIKDVESLRKDCSTLYQQFPITEDINDTNKMAKYGREYAHHIFIKIPSENWPSSIRNLRPFEVERDVFGISIWIKTNNPSIDISTFAENWLAKGYFVACNFKFTTTVNAQNGGRFFFTPINLGGIYEFVTPAEVE